MNRHLIALCIALVASTKVYGYSTDNGYQHQAEAAANADVGEYQLQTGGVSSASSGASANGADSGGSFYGSGQNIAYKPVNSRGNSVSSYISYPNNKGEILIHRPAAIIVKRPPTKVVVNHPPLVVKPAPVVLHKPPAVIVRKVFVKHHPRPVKVEPVYVNVVKPPAEKYFVNEKQQANYAPQGGYAPVSVNADFAPINGIGSAALAPNGATSISGSVLSGAGYGGADVESAVANAGYRLLQNNQGLAALANLSGSGGSAYDTDVPSHSSYSAPSY